MKIIRFKGDNNDLELEKLVTDGIIQYLLPAGFFVLLTGLFWLGEKSIYHKFYYFLVATPTLVVVILNRTGKLKKLLRNPIIFTFILFGAYTILTLFWSDTDHSITSLARRPVNTLMLFLAFGLVALKTPGKILNVLAFSAKVAAACGGLSLVYFYYTHFSKGLSFNTLGQFYGYGAIDNPLLTSHVYGFFTSFFLTLWFSGRYSKPLLEALSFAILIMVILSTGSRTPLLALTITLAWLSLCYRNRRSFIAIGISLSSIIMLLLVYPKAFMQRGLSYRPEIWLEAFKHGVEKLWFGHGFDHNLSIHVETTRKVFYDPHNIELAVFIEGGLVGITLWLALYTIALCYAWRNRDNFMVMISSALLVYGLAAGLTEGSGYLTRPKEHWFLIWIPFALISSTWISSEQQRKIQLESRDI